MADGVSEALEATLRKGPLEVGEVRIEAGRGGWFTLHHIEDSSLESLTIHATAEAVLEIALYDESNQFRPLKTAPNLRRGWVLRFAEVADVRRAVDYFYPGRLEIFLAAREKRLEVTPLRSTLNRQTGMYRRAANVSDEEIDEIAFEVCRSDGGCLRTILWKKDGTEPASTRLPANKYDPEKNQARGSGQAPASAFLPLLCQEACTVLIEACRRKAHAVRKTSS